MGTVTIQFVLTNKDAIELEDVLYRDAERDHQAGLGTTGEGWRLTRGALLRHLADLVRGQRRSQQKFNLEGD